MAISQNRHSRLENTQLALLKPMIADRLLRRDVWEAKLRSHGCEPLPGKGHLNGAEWWHKPGQYPFTVPVEDDEGNCEFWAIYRLIEDLGKTPPPNPFKPVNN